MERKSVKKSKRIEALIDQVSSDDEQHAWENKELGAEKKHTKKSNFYKAPAKLISIRIPDDVLDVLKILAEKEGLKYQTYVVSLLKKHTRQKKVG